ncbi:MAG: ASCH domain-containing protein [Lachnospiraceae bacterium]|jgi:hypothetical protein|nr:ASCH domain-containing protein [Lachnospiraceae bacterium]
MLILPIKKKWFDMIKSGEKKQEYREIKPYWTKRFLSELNKRSITCNFSEEDIIGSRYFVIFKNGYKRNSPQIKCNIELHKGYGKPEWGAEEGKKYYILEILEVEDG